MSGRTKGTWESGSNWHHGKTQTIRVPMALAQKVLDYARALDNHVLLPGNVAGIVNQLIILQAIDLYIEWRRQNYRCTENSQMPNLDSRGWDELRKFRAMVAHGDKGTNS